MALVACAWPTRNKWPARNCCWPATSVWGAEFLTPPVSPMQSINLSRFVGGSSASGGCGRNFGGANALERQSGGGAVESDSGCAIGFAANSGRRNAERQKVSGRKCAECPPSLRGGSRRSSSRAERSVECGNGHHACSLASASAKLAAGARESIAIWSIDKQDRSRRTLERVSLSQERARKKESETKGHKLLGRPLEWPPTWKLEELHKHWRLFVLPLLCLISIKTLSAARFQF